MIQEAEGNPKTVQEAQSHSNWLKWKEAMDHEISSLEHASTWTTIPCLHRKNVVGCKWVFRLKRKADGSIDKYKACLVARGFTQIYGIDYYDTYSPVVWLTTSAKINISYSILFHLTTSYSSYFGGKKGISRNKTSFFLLMLGTKKLVKPLIGYNVDDTPNKHSRITDYVDLMIKQGNHKKRM